MVRRIALIGCFTAAVLMLPINAQPAPRTYRVIQTDQGTRVEEMNRSLIRRLLRLPDRFVLIRIRRNPKGVSGFDKAITQRDMEKPPRVSETIRRSTRGLIDTAKILPARNRDREQIDRRPADRDPVPRRGRSSR